MIWDLLSQYADWIRLANMMLSTLGIGFLAHGTMRPARAGDFPLILGLTAMLVGTLWASVEVRIADIKAPGIRSYVITAALIVTIVSIIWDSHQRKPPTEEDHHGDTTQT